MRTALLAGVLAALLVPQVARAHVTVLPTFLENGKRSTLVFSAPNERAPHAVTRLTVTVPAGVELEQTAPPPGWTLGLSAGTATWSGGSTPPRAVGQFPVAATGDTAPGALTLVAVQYYDDGASVSWTIPLTILPGDDATKQAVWPAVVAGIAGVIVLVGGLAFIRSRYRPR